MRVCLCYGEIRVGRGIRGVGRIRGVGGIRNVGRIRVRRRSLPEREDVVPYRSFSCRGQIFLQGQMVVEKLLSEGRFLPLCWKTVFPTF